MTGDSLIVTVVGPGSIILPAGMTLAANQSAAFPVTLSSAAPAGGVTITLASSDNTKATISPTSVFVTGGATTPAVQPQVAGANYGLAAITASAPGYTSASQVIQIQAGQSGASLSFSPTSLTIVSGVNYLQLNLSAPAPAGGLVVNLSSSNTGVATVPQNVAFTAGATSVSVPVTGISAGSATITATSTASDVGSASATVTMTSGRDIMLPSGVVVAPGQQVNVPVTLAQPAPAGGVFVSLNSSNPSAATISPANVIIPQGQTALSRPPVLTGMASGSASVSASAFNMIGDTQLVLVGTAASLLPASLSITGVGVTQNLSLTLSSPAPAGGVTFNLRSSNPAVAITPMSASVAAGSSSVSIPVTSVAPGTTVIHVNALPNFGDITASVTVVAAGTIGLPTNVTVPLGQSVPFPVTLGAPAPTGGLAVTLASSDPTRLSVSPATVTIAAGFTTPAVQPQITGLAVGPVTMSATAPGYSGASQVVQVNGTLAFSPPSLSINAGAAQTLTLTLSGPISTALPVSLVSSNPSVATVPGSTTFAAGVTTISVLVTSVSAGSATITASGPYLVSATATVTVGGGSAPGAITLPANVQVGPNQAVPFPVTLSTPAPAGGVTVSLSSNSSAATVTQSVSISAGSTTPATQPQVLGVNFGTAVITASAPGYTSASHTVQVGATLSFSQTSLTISGIKSSSLQLNLSAPAPTSGLVVNLSSTNTGSVTVPATATFAANSTSITIAVSAVAVGSATITATSTAANVTAANATVTVTATSARDIILPTSAVLTPGQVLPYQMALAQPAPSTGAFVTLTSSDTSKVTVYPQNIFVQPGQTTGATTPQLTGVAAGSATITASAFNMTGDTEPVLVTGAGTGSYGFSPSSLTFTAAGASQNLALNFPVPVGGLVVTLSSTNPAVATVPSTVTVATGSSSVVVPVTSVGSGSTVIHASATGYSDTTATVSVQSASSGTSIILQSNASVMVSQSVWFTVAIGSPAPYGGVNVMLTSSNPSIATISWIVNIPAGATTPGVQAALTGYGPGTATITATSAGYTTATATVTVTPSDAKVTWYGACWTHATFYGITGNFQGVDYSLTTSTPVTVQATLFFNANCDPSQGGDNMNDFGLTTPPYHLTGFTHYPDVIPSSAIFWVGPRTADGLCPAGALCSGCYTYTASTPDCSTMP